MYTTASLALTHGFYKMIQLFLKSIPQRTRTKQAKKTA